MFEELEREMARLFLERFGQQVEEARSWLRSQLGPDIVHDDIRFIPGSTGDWFAFELEKTTRVVSWLRFTRETHQVVLSSHHGVALLTNSGSEANARVFFALMLERDTQDHHPAIKPEFSRTWEVEEGAPEDWRDPVQFTLQGYGARYDVQVIKAHAGEHNWWQSMGWLGPYAPGHRLYVPEYGEGWDQVQVDA